MDCRALKRLTNVCSAVAVMGWAAFAQAQRAPEDVTPPPTPGPSEQPPAQALPPCPPGGQAQPSAEAVPPAPPPEMAPAPEQPRERHYNKVFAPNSISITSGAGAANYFGTSAGDSIETGAAYDARLMMGARSALALEAAYMGAVNNVEVGGGTHGVLFSNGFDGDVRLQLPTKVQPYVFGGVGYNHIEVRNNGTGVADVWAGEDNQVTIPAGGGVTAYVGRHFNVDARGTYRFIPDNGITEMGTGRLHQWIAQAHLGYVF